MQKTAAFSISFLQLKKLDLILVESLLGKPAKRLSKTSALFMLNIDLIGIRWMSERFNIFIEMICIILSHL